MRVQMHNSMHQYTYIPPFPLYVHIYIMHASINNTKCKR